MTTPDDRSAGHPELEELAALIDGRLSAERAARVRAHLATCAECREVFFETVDFVRDEEARKGKSPLPPFERPRTRVQRSWRTLIAYPAAALLALSLSIAFYLRYTAAPDVPALAFTLAEDLSSRQPSLSGHFGDRNRGTDHLPDETSILSFRLGVALVNLQVSLAGRNADEADAALAKINGLNMNLVPAPKVKDFYLGLRKMPEQELWQQAERAKSMALKYRSPVPSENLFLDFGLWAEAGKLASWAPDGHFLTSRDNRRFPDYLRRQLQKDGESLPSEVQGSLKQIEETLDRDPLGADDYRRLAAQYERIVEFYERASEQEPQ
jgi:putative zinc finger protein